MVEGEKKTERKNLTITQVEEIKKVGKNQVPKLSFKVKDGDSELSYFTFRNSLFEAIKVGQTINADVETSTRDWEGTIYTDRRVVQIYVDGQPIGGKKEQFYRGKSPEELELSARSYALSYAKDLAVADKIKVVEIINQAEIFYNWVKKNEPKAPEPKLETKESVPSEGKSPAPKSKAQDKPSVTKQPETITTDEDWEMIGEEVSKMPSGKAIQNITEFKGLLNRHHIATHEAYEILSIKGYDELKDIDEAWERIKKAKGI